MRVGPFNSWAEAWQANGEVPETSVASLLLGSVLMLLLLWVSCARPPSADVPEIASSLLSHNMIDTDFLTRCAERHQELIQNIDWIAPEIRHAVIQLAASSRP